MPKTPQTISSNLQKFVNEFPDLKTDGNILFCNICYKSVNSKKIYYVKQHISSARHIEFKEKSNNKKSKQLLISELPKKSLHHQFAEDLCETFISADIPLYKIRNSNLKIFLEKYTDYKIPSDSTLRDKYIFSLYNRTIDNIKYIIKNKFLWISIDETMDSTGRYVANVILGILSADDIESKKRFLLSSTSLERVNHSTIARLFDDSLRILGNEFNKDSILLFISDAAPYMTKAGRAIKIFYPKITHVTCVAHGIHLVCEKVRELFPDVDSLISNIKKIFLKSPNRIAIFKDMEPELPLPPQPILTRWGTWLAAVSYYAKTFEKIVRIIDSFDKDDASCITIARRLLQNDEIKSKIIFIASNYSFIESSITKLETKGISLQDQVIILESLERSFNADNSEKGVCVNEKFKNVFEKNSGLSVLRNIASILNGTSTPNNMQNIYTVEEMLSFKFAPLTSVDVERSFSMYKNILRPNRQSFLFENLSQIFVIYCNKNLN